MPNAVAFALRKPARRCDVGFAEPVRVLSGRGARWRAGAGVESPGAEPTKQR